MIPVGHVAIAITVVMVVHIARIVVTARATGVIRSVGLQIHGSGSVIPRVMVALP